MNDKLIEKLHNKYLEIFNETPQVLARAPGRANIIGEHTDYNGGFVLPVGVDKNIYAFSSKRNDRTINIYSYDFRKSLTFSLDELTYDKDNNWVNYQKGVINELLKAGYELSGFNMAFGGGGGSLRPPVLLPPAPPPPTQLDAGVRRVRQSIANRARAAGGRKSTVATSAQGFSEPAQVAEKSLLGV